MNYFPVPANEQERLKALRRHDILDTLSEPEFNRITELAAMICDVPISLVTLVDEKRQWFKSVLGLDVHETHREISFCTHVIMETELLEVPNTMQDHRFSDNSLVTGPPAIRFYAGYPVIDQEGFALGTLCVADLKERHLTDEQKRALQLLAGQVMELITERRQKQELMSFQKMFNLANDLVFMGGDDGVFKRVNQAFTRLLGWSEDYLLNTATFEFVHPDDIAVTVSQLERLAMGEPKVSFLQRFKTVTGEYKCIEWTCIPQSASGIVFGTGRDVTEKLKLERTLARTRDMLERTNTVARVGGWELDLRKQKLYWTPVTKDIHAMPADYEPTLASTLEFYKPGESRELITAAINNAVSMGTPWDLELQIINARSKEVWVHVIGNAVFEDGVCRRLYGTLQDIDDHKRVEIALMQAVNTQKELNKELKEKAALVQEQDKTIQDIKEYKFLADSIPEIIWTSNPDGTMEYYNRYWFDYTGMTLEETAKFGWAFILHPDDIEKDYLDWTHCLNTGTPYQSEVRFKRKTDGTYRWHLARALPMKNDKGEVIKWFGSCTDIDEYKRALILENKISQFEDFNRIIAHNLRGPAASIEMLLNMINDEEIAEEKDALFNMLKTSSFTLNDTLDELMKVLEVRNNKNMAYDQCFLPEMVAITDAMLKGQIVATKAQITTSLQVPVMMFPKMYLESIFYNMVSNSLKYSKPGVPPEIHISSKTEDGRIVLEFSDNGLGIDLGRHGQNMFKLNSVFHKGYDSKGVGLFMTKTQIETFGGKITVESEPNVGTKFTIVF
ncbi:PAS domain-containing protein [Mucilaginibacter psychrotolerans]|uniref:histidine kinase n=1 Tax=Mucilaginibacter psychrotolerans TaxID=1524096 RepID=A0A4Y8SEJ4_9SPHI|nr:PAS domain-containing protein [Mucilaginibacter psychrotolerans]TFF37469.1 PAS domain S-box protein [Mucilaginibacter psychrotolerans]